MYTSTNQITYLNSIKDFSDKFRRYILLDLLFRIEDETMEEVEAACSCYSRCLMQTSVKPNKTRISLSQNLGQTVLPLV